MFTVTRFSYIEVLFHKFCSYQDEKYGPCFIEDLNRGSLHKGSTAVH